MNCGEINQLAAPYLSGELDPARRAACAAHLNGCRACAADIEQQREIDARLRAGVLAEDLDCRILEQKVRSRIASDLAPWARVLLLASGLAAVLMLGGLVYRTAARPARVYQEAALDHRREIVERQSRPWLTQPASLQAVARSLGLPPDSVLALGHGAYRLEKGKICRLDGRLFLHLVYTDGSQEFSVYLREGEHLSAAPRETANGKPLFLIASGADYLAALESGPVTALFVGRPSAEAALSLARSAAPLL